jgi:hypothetical protein
MMKKKYLKRRTENGGGASGMVRFSSSDDGYDGDARR